MWQFSSRTLDSISEILLQAFTASWSLWLVGKSRKTYFCSSLLLLTLSFVAIRVHHLNFLQTRVTFSIVDTSVDLLESFIMWWMHHILYLHTSQLSTQQSLIWVSMSLKRVVVGYLSLRFNGWEGNASFPNEVLEHVLVFLTSSQDRIWPLSFARHGIELSHAGGGTYS